MKLFVISDIHGATKPIEKAASLIREADWVVIAGDITRTKTRAEAADVIACVEQYYDPHPRRPRQLGQAGGQRLP